MNEVVLYLVCVVPVACSTAVALACGYFAWRVFARVEVQNRDLLKVVMALAQQPAAPQIAAMMEGGDAAIGKTEAEKLNGGIRRPRQMT